VDAQTIRRPEEKDEVIEVTTKERIRFLHLAQGWSQRQIARELGIARDTVAKYLAEEPADPPRYRLTTPRRRPVCDPVLPILQRWLDEDEQQPRKQRRTAHQMWGQLRQEYGFAGSEPVVRLRVRELKQRRREVFSPLAFGPGERAEVDWGDAQIIMAGQVITVQLFCARLRYSNLPFVMAFPHQPQEEQEALCAGHRAAFADWGAVPRELTYANLTTAVRTILTGHSRTEQAAFGGLKMT
jgi:transposase